MPNKKAKVVEVHSACLTANGQIDSARAIEMFKTAFDKLSSTGLGDDFLEQLFPVGTNIGIKINTLAGRMLSTSPVLVYALADVLRQVGHDKKRITIWDRRETELKRAGYKIQTSSSDYLCFATDTAGVGFDGRIYSHKSIGSLVSKIQTGMTDTVINFPVLKDHWLAGLSGCLKNYYGVIHNPNKYHENMCNPYQADLYALDIIRGKQRLAAFDAVRVQYEGGPGYVSQLVEPYQAILLSTDAVALDRVGIEIIDRLRTKNGLRPLKEVNREPTGVITASKDGLGCADLEDIEWLRVEI